MFTILELVELTGQAYGTVWNHMNRGYCKWPKREVKGQSSNSAYKCWEGMIQRCTNPNTPGYEAYGGAGVIVHPEFLGFQGFLNHIGTRPSMQHSIDRINPYGNYEPGNVRWATMEVQQSNKRMPKCMNPGGVEKHGRKYRFIYHGQKMLFSTLEEALETKQRLYKHVS